MFWMCDDLVVYASACVLRSKITCAEKIDYSEEEVHRFNVWIGEAILIHIHNI